MTKTEQTIFDFIRDHFEIGDDPEFTADINVFDSGFVDSLGSMEILAFLEDHFRIEITQGDLILYPMNSVEEMAAVVDRKRNG